ncbi:class I SAM-dependent methyltransferase [Pontibacillus salicampi]|uniref:Class I SAM-dependent methyltransferase n=1 Tax=Pontibacillus salicampi TaxID=1449801 RepID=A0ABV6LTY3_9BACI
MSEHYYSKNPESKSAEKHWNFTLRGRKISFTTDYGVFSKEEVDYGSRVLIEAFQSPDIDGDILDMGCGYGPIGIALALHFPDRNIVMVDVNERAIDLAKRNAVSNQADNTVITASDQYENIKDRQFAAILTNPPIRAGKQVVHSILRQSYEQLLPDGELWVVIQKKQGAPSARALMEEMFDTVEVAERDKGYYVYKAKKFDLDN